MPTNGAVVNMNGFEPMDGVCPNFGKEIQYLALSAGLSEAIQISNGQLLLLYLCPSPLPASTHPIDLIHSRPGATPSLIIQKYIPGTFVMQRIFQFPLTCTDFCPLFLQLRNLRADLQSRCDEVRRLQQQLVNLDKGAGPEEAASLRETLEDQQLRILQLQGELQVMLGRHMAGGSLLIKMTICARVVSFILLILPYPTPI